MADFSGVRRGRIQPIVLRTFTSLVFSWFEKCWKGQIRCNFEVCDTKIEFLDECCKGDDQVGIICTTKDFDIPSCH